MRAEARRLALALALRPDPGARAPTGRRRLSTAADPDAADLDLDATLARLDVSPRLRGEDVRTRDWQRHGSAVVLVVDTSGSVTGRRLATGVLVAGAVAGALRPGDELAVVAFARDAVVVRPVDATARPADAVEGLLDLRGGGTTDLAHGLRVGLAQAARARAPRREVVVLTDGLVSAGDDPVPVARRAGRSGARVHVLGLAADDDATTACTALAAAGGGRHAPLLRPEDAPAAVAAVLGPGAGT